MDTGLNFLMFVSAFETALLIIMWCYIYEFKMRTAERVSKLDSEVYELTMNSYTRELSKGNHSSVDDYSREEYKQKVSRLLDMALRQS